jgi:hypothetical protein
MTGDVSRGLREGEIGFVFYAGEEEKLMESAFIEMSLDQFLIGG